MPPQELLVFRFECPICHKKLARSTTLKEHMRRHTGEKPFSCTTCQETFARNYDRKQHEKTHTLDFRFVCHGVLSSGFSWGCGAGFHRKYDLARHYKSRTGSLCRNRLHEVDGQETMKGGLNVDGLSIASSTREDDLAAVEPSAPTAAPLGNNRGSSVHNYEVQEVPSPELMFDDDHASVPDDNVVVDVGRPETFRSSAKWKELFYHHFTSLPAPSFLPYWLQQTTPHGMPRDAESWVLSGSVGGKDPFDHYFADYCKSNKPDTMQLRDSATSRSQSVESLVQTHPGPVESDLRDEQELNEPELLVSEAEDDETRKKDLQKVTAFAKIQGRKWPDGEEWSYFVREMQIRIGRSTDDLQMPVHVAIAKNKCVSRQHATIFWDMDNPSAGGWHIEVHGRNGVLVNGRLIERGCRQRLVSGDEFMISSTQMTFLTPDVPGE